MDLRRFAKIDNSSMKTVPRVVKTHVDESKIKESPLKQTKTLKRNNQSNFKMKTPSETSNSNFIEDENIANIDGRLTIEASNIEKSYLDENEVTVSPIQKVNAKMENKVSDLKTSTTSNTAGKNGILGFEKQESLKTDADLAITK